MKAPAFQFYPDDFIGGTVMFTAEEVGAYMRLLCFQWGNGSIPDRKDLIDRIAGCSVSQDVLDKFVDGKQPRLEIVRTKMLDFKEACSQAGKKGGGRPPLPEDKRLVKGTFTGPLADLSVSNKGQINSPSPSPTPSPTIPPAEEERKAPAPPDDDDEDLPEDPPPPPPPKRFTPPTEAEWLAYAATLNPAWPADDAAGAWTHYQANGWKVGRVAMKDWQSAAQNCHRRWKADQNRPLPFNRTTPPNHGSATQAALDQYR